MADDKSRQMSMDRRALIKKAGAGAAIAWAAPTVLASTAGAQTTTCYFVKLNRGSSTYEFSDGSCGIPESAYPNPGSLNYSITVSETQATGTVSSPGCYIQSIQLKTGGQNGCKTPVPGGMGITSLTVHNPVQQAISHVNMIFCCTSTGSI